MLTWCEIIAKCKRFLGLPEEVKVLNRAIKRYGWKPDLPDHRDFLFTAPKAVKLPPSIDLRAQCPAVVDQGQLGSCTANAIAGAYQFEELKQKKANNFPPSRLFIYYNERAIEGTTKYDSGAAIRDGIKTISKQGVCSEPEWPYIISKFKTKPSQQCYADAARNLALKYMSVSQTLDQMKSCLALGYPFVFGFSVYASFESAQVARTGIVPMPQSSEAQLGGHAVMTVGYDDSQQWFVVRNSWGRSWGVGGYCFMPYSYLNSPQLASDFWTIRLVE